MFLSLKPKKRVVEEKLAHDLLMLPSVKPNKGNVSHALYKIMGGWQQLLRGATM